MTVLKGLKGRDGTEGVKGKGLKIRDGAEGVKSFGVSSSIYVRPMLCE